MLTVVVGIVLGLIALVAGWLGLSLLGLIGEPRKLNQLFRDRRFAEIEALCRARLAAGNARPENNVRFNLAKALLGLERTDDAIDELQLLIAEWPHDDEARDLLNELLLQRAQTSSSAAPAASGTSRTPA